MNFKKNENKKLSKYFNSNELQCRCNYPDCIDQIADEKTLLLLDYIREIYGKPLKVNRFYSCPKHNKAIGGSPNSNHIKGKACDFSDIGENLEKFLTEEVLIKAEAYKEHPDYTKNWCHIQSVPPKSGRRIFKP